MMMVESEPEAGKGLESTVELEGYLSTNRRPAIGVEEKSAQSLAKITSNWRCAVATHPGSMNVHGA